MTELEQRHEKMLAMNEALMVGAVRQHELTASAEALNALLKVEIAERKELEEALHRAEIQLTARAVQLEALVDDRTAELRATNQQLEAFIYSIAHDLRAPLRIMQGFATMLVGEADADLTETGRNCASRINKSAQFMDALLIDLITFNRISKEQIKLVPVNLKTVIESVLSRLEGDIKEKNVQVENAVNWPVVMAHEQTLAQVLFHLVGNALKFNTPNVRPTVSLRTEIRDGCIRSWVEDNGPGIAPSHQAQIFQLFTRLNGETHPGTGAGLAIVRKGIERMGGAVGVVSAPGQGSRFWFELRDARSD